MYYFSRKTDFTRNEFLVPFAEFKNFSRACFQIKFLKLHLRLV